MPSVRTTIHPTVQAAIDETLREAMNPALSGADADGKRALSDYYRLRQKRLVPVFAVGLVVLIFFLLMATSFEVGATEAGIASGLAMLLGAAVLFTQARHLKITPEELEALSPALRLSRIQRAYLDARLVLGSLELPAETKDELGSQLDGLLDEETRLRQMNERGHVRSVRPQEVEAERDALRARLANEQDASAREALEHGLRTCERRLLAARNLSVASQRIDAQLEMIAQTMSDVRDGLLRLRVAPVGAEAVVDLEPIRWTLAHVQSHAAAIESAVSEVQSLQVRG